MYQKKNVFRPHPKYSNEEKEKIVQIYLKQEIGISKIVRDYDLANKNVLYRWVNQFKEFGCFFETRGNATKYDNPRKGRPRKYSDKPLEEYTKDELIEKVRMLEDIKKSMVYLASQSQNKNIK